MIEFDSKDKNKDGELALEEFLANQSEPDAANPGSDPYMTAFAIVLLREAGNDVIGLDNPAAFNWFNWT